MVQRKMTITLFTFGPSFGLPDPSPFVMKAELLLKMAGLPYATDSGGFRKGRRASCPICATESASSRIRP